MVSSRKKRLPCVVVLRDREKCFGDSGVNSPGKTGLAPTCYNNTLGSKNGVNPLIPLGREGHSLICIQS